MAAGACGCATGAGLFKTRTMATSDATNVAMLIMRSSLNFIAVLYIMVAAAETTLGDQSDGPAMTVWDRVFDPVRRPERPLALLATNSEDRNSPSPNPGILGFGLDQPRSHRVLTHVVHPIDKAIVRAQNMIEKLLLPNWSVTLEATLISRAERPLMAFMISGTW